jgi:IS30 family transposase
MMASKYTNLNINERIQIQSLRESGVTLREIGLSLNRSASSVCRELNRNRIKLDNNTHQYVAAAAQTRSAMRRTEAKTGSSKIPLEWDNVLAKTVQNQLAYGKSPEQVSGRLKLQYPDDPTMHVSHETIYQRIYVVPRGELRSELMSQLRQNHKERMPRSRGKPRKSKILNAVPISERPASVNDRNNHGHWEGDFIKGAYNRSAIGTLVERTSRLVLLSAVGGCTAQHALEGFTKRLLTVPTLLRNTLTYDNGSEMAMHEQLAKNVNIKVYFCEPYSPWQRGSNENMNALVRQYLPKSTDLSTITPQKLRYIEDALNNRPRKILNFRTPREVFEALKSGLTFEQAINIDIRTKIVALQG